MATSELAVVFDESISYRICAAFQGFCADAAGLTFISMQKRMAGTKDPEWLNGVFPDDPPHIVIARDSILRPRAQTLMWMKGGLTVVVIDTRLGNIGLEHLTSVLFRWWPTILATILGTPRQGVFVIPPRFSNRERLPKMILEARKKRKRKSPKKKGRKTMSMSKRARAEQSRRKDERQISLNLQRPSRPNP